jgi:penicillin-binding protein 2
VFNSYATTFGLGHKLGVDLPSEKNGNLPVSSHYRKLFGPRWYSCNVISNAIGQGEINTTMMQLSNVMAIIANKGWYYTPHAVDSIDGGDELGVLDAFKEKHYVDKRVPDVIFDAVQDGMQAVVDYGTAVRSKIPDIVMCGKTGTVQNFAKINGVMVAQQDHSFFGGFAGRDNPKIAIAVICENAGQGAWAAAPIASLLVEKYLKDSIRGKERNDMLVEFENKNLIPRLMKMEMLKMDSLKRIRENQQLIQQRLNKEASDSADSEENTEPEIKAVPSKPKTIPPKRKTENIPAVIIDEKKNKKPAVK